MLNNNLYYILKDKNSSNVITISRDEDRFKFDTVSKDNLNTFLNENDKFIEIPTDNLWGNNRIINNIHEKICLSDFIEFDIDEDTFDKLSTLYVDLVALCTNNFKNSLVSISSYKSAQNITYGVLSNIQSLSNTQSICNKILDLLLKNVKEKDKNIFVNKSIIEKVIRKRFVFSTWSYKHKYIRDKIYDISLYNDNITKKEILKGFLLVDNITIEEYISFLVELNIKNKINFYDHDIKSNIFKIFLNDILLNDLYDPLEYSDVNEILKSYSTSILVNVDLIFAKKRSTTITYQFFDKKIGVNDFYVEYLSKININSFTNKDKVIEITEKIKKYSSKYKNKLTKTESELKKIANGDNKIFLFEMSTTRKKVSISEIIDSDFKSIQFTNLDINSIFNIIKNINSEDYFNCNLFGYCVYLNKNIIKNCLFDIEKNAKYDNYYDIKIINTENNKIYTRMFYENAKECLVDDIDNIKNYITSEQYNMLVCKIKLM